MCCVLGLVTQSCLTLCHPRTVACKAPLSMWTLQARILEWVAIPSSKGSYQTRNWTQASCIVGGFFTSWGTRKAQEYWSGSQSLLQGNFPIQKSNWGLLHCKGILYQLSYLGSALSAHNPMANLGRSVLSSLFLLHFLFFSPAFLILSSIKACHFLPLPSPSGSLQEVFNKASSYHPNCTF